MWWRKRGSLPTSSVSLPNSLFQFTTRTRPDSLLFPTSQWNHPANILTGPSRRDQVCGFAWPKDSCFADWIRLLHIRELLLLERCHEFTKFLLLLGRLRRGGRGFFRFRCGGERLFCRGR